MRVIINGAGIAGPTLAYWLRKAGHEVVIGADGLHSRVRQLVFGSDTGVEVSLGYHVAAFEVEGYRPRDELVYLGYGVPGRQIYRFAMREDKTLFLFAFRDEYLPAGAPTSEQDRKA